MKTNFLTDGAVVQLSDDQFQVFCGPYETYSSLEEARRNHAGQPDILYKPGFWDFLRTASLYDTYRVYDHVEIFDRRGLVDFIAHNAAHNGKTGNREISFGSPSIHEFELQFDWIRERILTSQLKKGLPISVQKGRGNAVSLVPEMLRRILDTKTPHFLYGAWNEGEGLIGSTPELLVNWHLGTQLISTTAVAGTWKKSDGILNPDFNDQKIRREHEYVIEDILAQLKFLELESRSSTRVLELPFLFHLKTDFVFHADSLDTTLRAITSLHPTAALGLFPRDQSNFVEFSRFKLQAQRGMFGAPFGVIGNRRTFVVVAIRNVTWSGDEMSIFAGCGVTEDSDLQAEWKEILAKVDAVKKTLGFAF